MIRSNFKKMSKCPTRAFFLHLISKKKVILVKAERRIKISMIIKMKMKLRNKKLSRKR
jgi:hypothetical protein